MNCLEFEIGGKQRGFRFGLKFLGDLLTHFDCDMGGLGLMIDKNPFATRPVILYLAHKAYCQSNKKPIDFTEDDVCTWVDEMPNGISNDNVVQSIRMVIEAIQSHLPKIEEIAEEETDSKKK